MSFCRIVRIDPIKPYNGRAFQWHHDGWGKYVLNIMILLSDLPKEGQRTLTIVVARMFCVFRGTTVHYSHFISY